MSHNSSGEDRTCRVFPAPSHAFLQWTRTHHGQGPYPTVRTTDPGARPPGFTSCFCHFFSCVNSGELPASMCLSFPHLKDGDNHNTQLISCIKIPMGLIRKPWPQRLWRKVSELVYVTYLVQRRGSAQECSVYYVYF